MRFSLRPMIAALGLAALLAPAPGAVDAQGLFEPVIIVNESSITRFELEQRARLMQLFRAPGDPRVVARQQLIEDRLKLGAAVANGIILSDEDLSLGIEEFAGRANLSSEEMISSLNSAGVAESTLRDFVRSGLSWRELTRARFANRVSVTEDDIERARLALSGSSSSVRVLLSEIIMPAPPAEIEAVTERAARIAQVSSEAAFSAEARRYSASRTAARGGRMDWIELTNLPAALRQIILGLAPGEVTEPLPLEGAVALFQLRDIEEIAAPPKQYSAIEYAIYYLPGGPTAANLARVAQIDAETDRCDDLYGVAYGQPPEVLERTSMAPDEIPQELAMVLAQLDDGEVGTITRAGGEALGLVMMCGRAPMLEGDGPTEQDITGFITNSRISSFANGYLEELRAEARIVERE